MPHMVANRNLFLLLSPYNNFLIGRYAKMRNIKNLFCDHPATINETYVEHFVFAMKFGGMAILAGLAALAHAIFPFLFKSSASRIIKNMADTLASSRRSSATQAMKSSAIKGLHQPD